MRVRNAVVTTVALVGLSIAGASSALACERHDGPDRSAAGGYSNEGFAGRYSNIGGPAGLTTAEAAGYDHDGGFVVEGF
ncbi:hypothetical protein [Streptomyces sp. NPDC046887]|uniref:hypothetical protein n=1 Tax=Streptomyces sp. NPDC046887 TaxID=3155472 RepID=UPI0033CD36BA